jgi:hypothetical protein
LVHSSEVEAADLCRFAISTQATLISGTGLSLAL